MTRHDTNRSSPRHRRAWAGPARGTFQVADAVDHPRVVTTIHAEETNEMTAVPFGPEMTITVTKAKNGILYDGQSNMHPVRTAYKASFAVVTSSDPTFLLV